MASINQNLSRQVMEVVFLFGIIGTMAFAVSGACVAIEKEMDIFVGLLTGVGGGVLRDLFAGKQPYILSYSIG